MCHHLPFLQLVWELESSKSWFSNRPNRADPQFDSNNECEIYIPVALWALDDGVMDKFLACIAALGSSFGNPLQRQEKLCVPLMYTLDPMSKTVVLWRLCFVWSWGQGTEHGHHPDFQSCGKKGSNQILLEMGLDTSGSGPTQAKLLNSQPN